MNVRKGCVAVLAAVCMSMASVALAAEMYHGSFKLTDSQGGGGRGPTCRDQDGGILLEVNGSKVSFKPKSDVYTAEVNTAGEFTIKGREVGNHNSINSFTVNGVFARERIEGTYALSIGSSKLVCIYSFVAEKGPK